jgi:hypothetical protein
MQKSDIKVANKWNDGYSHEVDRDLSSLDLDSNFVTLGDAVVQAESDIDALQAGTVSVTAIDDEDSPYTVLATDNTIYSDDTSGAVTVNLPAATGSGRTLTLIKASASNTSTLDADGSDTINGAGTLALASQYDAAVVKDSASALWIIISQTDNS